MCGNCLGMVFSVIWKLDHDLYKMFFLKLPLKKRVEWFGINYIWLYYKGRKFVISIYVAPEFYSFIFCFCYFYT